MMQEYIESCADRLLYALGYPKVYNSKNPFDWMQMISIEVNIFILLFREKLISLKRESVNIKKQEFFQNNPINNFL